jgi:hypothetical protein
VRGVERRRRAGGGADGRGCRSSAHLLAEAHDRAVELQALRFHVRLADAIALRGAAAVRWSGKEQ